MLKDDYNTTSATTSAATVVVPTYLDRSISAPPLSGYASFEVIFLLFLIALDLIVI
jgi:hypothetical protein